ncbi:MAG: glycogen/starch synthase, partial [Deltaproteobacteria bacterium]|nr:glycogen/starch synthase [Deltaproteobacteria bacterium]
MRVVHVSSEIAPFAQSGGLADVLAGLPPALADMHGLDVAVVAPLYRGVDTKLAAAGIALDSGAPITVSVGPHHMAGALRRARLGGVMLGF